MLTIRLTRVGKRKQPIYRLAVTEKSRDPWGKMLEFVGQYNPRMNPIKLELNTDRIKHWLSKGAQASDTVWNLLVDAKVVEGEKRRKVQISQRRKDKLAKKQTAA